MVTETIPPKKEEVATEPVFQALSRILGVLPRVASGLIAFGSVAYIVGWIEARSYFNQFGASWLTEELSATNLLTHSWTPLVLLLFFMWLGITDLAEGGAWRAKATLYTLRYGWYIPFVLLIIEAILNTYILNKPFFLLSHLNAIIWIFVAGAAFEAIILSLQTRNLSWDHLSASLIYAVVVLGLYFTPDALGRSQGLKDRDPQFSSLPILKLHSETPTANDLRLLFFSGDRFYAIQLADKKTFPEILILNRSDVLSIQKVVREKSTKSPEITPSHLPKTYKSETLQIDTNQSQRLPHDP